MADTFRNGGDSAGTTNPKPFTKAARRVTIASFLLGASICLSIALVQPFDFLSLTVLQLALIAFASWLIALASLLPGVAREFGVRAGSVRNTDLAKRAALRTLGDIDTESESLGIVPEFAASMLVRLAGTVALFMLCHYQMAAPEREIASWVLIWYAVLMFVELFSLHRSLIRGD